MKLTHCLLLPLALLFAVACAPVGKLPADETGHWSRHEGLVREYDVSQAVVVAAARGYAIENGYVDVVKDEREGDTEFLAYSQGGKEAYDAGAGRSLSIRTSADTKTGKTTVKFKLEPHSEPMGTAESMDMFQGMFPSYEKAATD